MKKRLVSTASIASIAVTIAVFAALFGLIAPVQGAWFTTYGQVFDTDGTTPVDGVSVTITNLETGSSIEPYVTALGGWYADNLANLKPNCTNKEGDRIQIVADDHITGKTNTTVVLRATLSPQEVNLTLQAPTPPTLFTIYGQVFDTDGTTPVDGVSVTITNLETGSSIEPYVTALGGWYADNLANLKPTCTNKEGDRIQIVADDSMTGKTNTTVVLRATLSPQEVNLTLQAPTPPAWFTIYGQVFDTDGTTPVNGVNVTITNLETGSSIEPYVTALGGWYADNLANLKPTCTNKVGDRIQIFADDGKTGKTNTTVVLRAAFSPQEVNLTLQASGPTPTPTPTPAPRRGGGGSGGGVRDTDGDGYSDIEELTTGTDPYDPCDPNPACIACVGERIVEELVSTPTPIAKPVATPKSAVKPTPKSVIPEPEKPEKKSVPGFEAGFTVAGLLAVAYLVRRRKKW